MQSGECLVEVLRGGRVESIHCGHMVICDAAGTIVEALGMPEQVVYPRSSCKMIQALPLVESGAAAAFGVSSEELALACASHCGAPIHTNRVRAWLARIGRADDDLCCGPELPRDEESRHQSLVGKVPVCRVHNNCSGKHAGFLTLARHLDSGPDYVNPEHPVQLAVRAALEETTGENVAGHGIDGCSAPAFATRLAALARAMAGFAAVGQDTPRGRAQESLFAAMVGHPELISGEGRADTELTRATGGRVAVKGGAEGMHVAIWPERHLGIALKITDGALRASDCAIAALLVRLGALSGDHPVAQRFMTPEVRNWRGTLVGQIRPAAALRA